MFNSSHLTLLQCTIDAILGKRERRAAINVQTPVIDTAIVRRRVHKWNLRYSISPSGRSPSLNNRIDDACTLHSGQNSDLLEVQYLDFCFRDFVKPTPTWQESGSREPCKVKNDL